MVAATKGLCKDFISQSRKTWNRIRLAESVRLNISEESITDFNLLELQRRHQYEIQTFKFNKRIEPREGADWEWWLISGSHFLGLRVQAKKIHSQTLSYPHLNYLTHGGRQIDILISKAPIGPYPKIPVYILYNFWDCSKYYAPWLCRFHRRDVRMLGCGVVEARALRTVITHGKNGLKDIANMMYPWSCLVCCQGPYSTNKTLPLRAFGFVSKAFKRIADFTYEENKFIIDKAPWYVDKILRERELSEEEQEKIGINRITVIKENETNECREKVVWD